MIDKVIIALLTLLSFDANAKNDSLFVVSGGEGWVIPHVVRPGETIFSIARRFHVPPAILSGDNGLSYQTNLVAHSLINIPVAAYNIVKEKPLNMGDARPLYYRVSNENTTYHISHYSNVPQRTIQQWNNLPGNTVEEGEVLFVGWVLYDATDGMKTSMATTAAESSVPMPSQQPRPYQYDPGQQDAKGTHTELIQMPVTDTMKLKSPEEQSFLVQTNNEMNVVTEKGPAVFFESAHHGTVYYAFHNGTPKDAIIKVHNPGNGKTIFVKVIGPLPEIKLYANSVIGICSAARAALGGEPGKVWVELSFAGY